MLLLAGCYKYVAPAALGAYTFASVFERPRNAGLETCATTLECLRVSRRMVARFQRLIAIMASNPGRCPGLSCGGLSGLSFDPSFRKRKGKISPLTEQLRGCDTAGLEACATRVCVGLADFTVNAWPPRSIAPNRKPTGFCLLIGPGFVFHSAVSIYAQAHRHS